MKQKDDKKIEKKKKGNGNELVNKESICAVCALFSLLAFLILCTKDLVFGVVGEDIHAFLLGLFGYTAFPAFLAFCYMSLMGLFGARLIKNRKHVALITCSALLLLFSVHTIQTVLVYGWDLDGYLARCFASGKEFPKTSLTGWFGGLVVYGATSLLSGIGATVILFLLFGLSVYLLIRTFNKTAFIGKEKKERASRKPFFQKRDKLTSEMSVADGNNNVQPPLAPHNGNGFSPFGGNANTFNGQNNGGFQDSREFLFDSTPKENYRRNLMFDASAKVNNLPSEGENPPTIENGYTPSYSNAYEQSVNENTQTAPLKIVAEERPYYTQEPQTESDYQEPSYYAPTPLQPLEPIQNEPIRYNSFEETAREDSSESFQEETIFEAREEPTEERGYQRHEYMNLFSLDNPNVFGREDTRQTEDLFGRENENSPSFDRAIEDETDRDRYSLAEEESEIREEGRDGLYLFDEKPEDNPYELRSDFEHTESTFDEAPVDLGTRENRWQEETFERGREMEEQMPSRFEEFSEPKKEAFIQEPIPTPPPKPKKPRVPKPYKRMSLDDLDCRDIEPTANQEEIERTKETIIATLEDFKVSGASIASVTFGPTVTRYNVTIPRNIHPRKIVALDQSIAINLYSEGVNIYPNYEDGVVSIEVPNKERQFVQLGCMLSGDTYVNAKSSSLVFAMGKDVANRKIYGDISKMIHLLVAGASGSGKSVFLGALIVSLIHKYSPEELRLILIDPKKTEFVLYNNLPHLMINEIITDVNKAVQSLNWAIEEMNRRYGLFEEMTRTKTYVVNLDQYNAQVDKTERLPKIVVIIDELADLMLAAKKDMEEKIQNLTQKARAAGIHLIVATQRPSTDVITGVIKSNLPTRIAFGVATDVDSRVILDQTGAQKLLGKGDFLYTMQGIKTPVRVQSAFISPEDSQKVVSFIKGNNEAYYDEEVTEYINKRSTSAGDSSARFDKDNVEPVYIEALRYVMGIGSASISMIQRKCSVGYNKAGKIVEWMEEMNYISAFDGARARKILITPEEFEKKYGNL